jgi:branched-chain amino acid transport system ATP-binding protein
MDKKILEVKELSLNYGGVKALEGVSLNLKEGEILSVLGGNGAGKTTLVNTLSGLAQPSKGEILYRGKPIHGLSPHKLVEMGIVQVPEGRGIFSTLTVLENLKVGAYLGSKKQSNHDSLEKIFAIFPVLRERKNQMGGSLSGGEQQMLAIGRGLMAAPKLLILDEPTLGLSPLMRQEVARVTQTINRTGTSIILVEQDANMALRISHRGLVMQIGRVVLEGKGLDLLNNPALQEGYLG